MRVSLKLGTLILILSVLLILCANIYFGYLLLDSSAELYERCLSFIAILSNIFFCRLYLINQKFFRYSTQIISKIKSDFELAEHLAVINKIENDKINYLKKLRYNFDLITEISKTDKTITLMDTVCQLESIYNDLSIFLETIKATGNINSAL